MINEGIIKDSGIYLDIWGQKFVEPFPNIVSEYFATDKEQMITLGRKMIEVGKMIERQAMYGKPNIAHTHLGAHIISIGFDKKGKVIIPEKGTM